MSSQRSMVAHPDGTVRHRVRGAAPGVRRPDAVGLPGVHRVSDAERACAVFVRSRQGDDVRAFLTDASIAVRAAAAMSPALKHNPDADAVLFSALQDPGALDAAFDGGPSPFLWKPSLALVPRAVAAVTVTRAELVDAALACVRYAPMIPADWGWGRFLVPILRDVAAGRSLDADQQRYLAGLVEIPEIWDPCYGATSQAFRNARLPYDRALCRRLAAGEPVPVVGP